jgi:hypothetical protein
VTGDLLAPDQRTEYLEERKLLIQAEREASQSFDKAMITLSAGALALSITFIRQLAPTPRDHVFLYVAWIGFILALITILTSFLASQSALRKQRDVIGERYQDKFTDGPSDGFFARLTNCLNWSSIVLFALGVASLTLFAVKNLPG